MPSNIPVQLPNGYLEFFSSLESWQNEQQIKLQANMQLAQVVEEPLRKIAKHRRPLITITGLEIDLSVTGNCWLICWYFLLNSVPISQPV